MNDVVLKLNVVETATEWILMCDSPAGGTSWHVPLPFTESDLTRRLHQLETSILVSSSKVARRSASPEATALKFGNEIAEVLLSGEARVLFEECRRLAKQSDGHVRLLLETDGPNVSQIPWEFAVDPKVKDDYLSLRLSLARHLRISMPVPPLTVKPPLRVLGVHAQPHDRPTLDFAEEQASVAALQSVSSDLVEVTWLEGDRWSDLSSKLDKGGWHVLHFIGHGGFNEDTNSGFLELSDDTGAALPIAARRLGATAAQSGDLRLVVLNACDSAANGAAGAFSSTAAKLMMEGIPAVVAMQYEITDPAALAFAAAFYESLARGKAVDQAVTKAREIVRVTQNSLEFATPVLYLASNQTQLFDVRPVQPPPSAPTPPVQGQSPNAPRTRASRAAAPPPATQPVAQLGARSGVDEPEPAWKTGIIDRINNLFTGGSANPTPPRPDPSGPTGSTTAATPSKESPAPSTVTTPRTASPPAPELDPDTPRLPRLGATPPLARTRAVSLGPRNLLALACEDGSVRAWRVKSRAWASRCGLPQDVHPRSLAWSPWPRHVASAQDDGTVVVWDLELEVPLRVLRPAGGAIASMAFSNNGKWLAVVGRNRSVEVFGAEGQTLRRFQVPVGTGPSAWPQTPQRVGPCTFSPDDRRLVVAANAGAVVGLDAHGKVVTTWPHAQPVCGLAVSESRVVTCMVDGRLRFWDWDGNHVRRHELPARVEHLAFSPDGELLATASHDRRLTTWSSGGVQLAVAALEGRPRGVGVGPDYLVTASDSGVVETWAASPTPRGAGADSD